MKHLLWIALVLTAPSWVEAQEAKGYWSVTRFHRIQLRNGNSIDGQMIQQTDRGVLMKLRGGEMFIRMDQVHRIEYVKMKTWNEPVQVVAQPVSTAVAATGAKPAEAAVAATHAKPVKADLMLIDSSDPMPVGIDRSVVSRADDLIRNWQGAPENLRLDLGRALTELGGGVAPYLAFRIEKRPKSTPLVPVTQALAVLDEDRFDALWTRMIQSEHAELRLAAVSALGRTNGSNKHELLVDALEDPVPGIWKAALEQLEKIPRSAFETRDLVDVLEGRLLGSAGNKLSLATALAKLGGHEARRAFWLLIRGSVDSERQIGIQGLAEVGGDEDGQRLVGLLRDSSMNIRKAACGTLGRLRYPAAVRDLVDMLYDEDEGLQKNARWALSQTTGQAVPDNNESWISWWTHFGSKEPRFQP
jgi:hypothetical protein